MRVLVVEDNRDSAETLRILLELLGHQLVAHRVGGRAGTFGLLVQRTDS